MTILKMKNSIKVFWWTSIFSATLFFTIGYIFFKELINYGDWVYVFFPIHIITTFFIMLPLLLPFWLIEKKASLTKKDLSIKILKKTLIGIVYIMLILWISIFSDSQQRHRNPFNYYEDLKYLGICSIITILTFALTEYYFTSKKAKIDYN